MITKTHTHTTSSVVIHHTSSYAHGISQSRSIRAVARRRARVNPPKRFCRCTYTPIRRINHPRCFIRINLRAFLPIRRHRSPHARARQRPSRAQRRRSPQPCGESDVYNRAPCNRSNRVLRVVDSRAMRCRYAGNIYPYILERERDARWCACEDGVAFASRADANARARRSSTSGRSVGRWRIDRWRSMHIAIARKHSSAFAIAMCIDRSIDRSCGWVFFARSGGCWSWS